MADFCTHVPLGTLDMGMCGFDNPLAVIRQALAARTPPTLRKVYAMSGGSIDLTSLQADYADVDIRDDI